MFKNFKDFKEFCKKVANNQNTMVEFREYPEYHWGQAAFMTDKFGGTYCCFKFDYDTLQVVDDFDTDIKPYETIENMVNHITERRKNEEEIRDFEALMDYINDEY